MGHFVIERKSYGIEPLLRGYINDTYTIKDGQTPVFLLQRINKNVFRDIPGLMDNLEAILPSLNGEGYYPVSFLYTKSRRPYYKDEEGEYWRLMSFVPHAESFDYTSDPGIATEAGRILGIFHKLIGDIPPETLKEVLPGFHDLGKRKEEFRSALENASRERKEKAAEQIAFADQLLDELEKEDLKELPIRICHNDTKLNNFLFSSETGKGQCLVDLDTVMPGFLHFDMGDAIRTLANPNPEDEIDLAKISFDLNMVRYFLKGIRESGLALKGDEKPAIAHGAVLMPFLHGLRALTDFLQNDRYYRVSYPDENLNRCKSLFAVAERARDHKAEIIAISEEVFGGEEII